MIDSEALKEAMRTWITGVAIVTGRHDGLVHGMTANSFNSIALDPPTVTVALSRPTRTRHLVFESGAFGVTILNTAQVELAKRFAGQTGTDQTRFDGVKTLELTTGAPFIKGGLAFLDCKVVHHFEVGSTTVFLGEVVDSLLSEDQSDPLLYFNRHWRKLHKL